MEVNKIYLNTIRLNQVGLNLAGVRTSKKREPTPTYLSCFGNGVWEDEGRWFNTDTWKSEIQNQPFLPTGFWNNEGIYRFKDAFNFGTSFLPTGFVMFEGIFRYSDKIKVQSTKKSVKNQHKINKLYWNF